MATGGNKPRNIIDADDANLSPSAATNRWLRHYGEIEDDEPHAVTNDQQLYPSLPPMLQEPTAPTPDVSFSRHSGRGRGSHLFHTRAGSEPSGVTMRHGPGVRHYNASPLDITPPSAGITTTTIHESTSESTPPVYRSAGISSLSDALAIVGKFQSDKNCLTWLNQFQSYTACRHIEGQDRIELFKLLMHSDALDWVLMLPSSVIINETSLYDAFRKRFGYSEGAKWRLESALYNRVQKDCESVDQFVTSLKMEALQLEIPESRLIKIVSQNLKNDTAKLLILDRNCKTLEQVLQIARNCEAAKMTDKPSRTDIEISDLKQMIANLTQSLSKNTLSNATLAPVQAQFENVDMQPESSHNNIGQPQPYTSISNSRPKSAQLFTSRAFHNRPPSSQTYRPSFQQIKGSPYQPQSGNSAYSYTNRQMGQPTGTISLPCTYFCGQVHALGRHNCPAQNQTCTYCHKIGHFQSVCQHKLYARRPQ